MYQTIRSGRTLSYDQVERRFDEHQAKWPEAVWIEDAMFKYIDPLINPDPGKEATAVYLPMLQGSKEGQRKWWLSNRFKYMDSKWNAGDALSQWIQIRGYAKADATITPYSDIYPTIKYGSYIVQQRGKQGVPTTLPCPLDQVNDTEIYFYSAPQIASVGDLSGFKVGFADFSQATRLQSIKVGDASNTYENPNLNVLTLGSNRMLSMIDARNCTALGTGDQKSLDLSGCPNIEEVYLDGTKLTGITMPNGGVLKKVHLPNTISILSVRNQPSITEFRIVYEDEFIGDGVTTEFELAQTPTSVSCVKLDGVVTDAYTFSGDTVTFDSAPGALVAVKVISYGSMPTGIRKARIENCSSSIDSKAIMMSMDDRLPIRLMGVSWTSENDTETRAIFDKLQKMRGIDSSDAELETNKAVVSGILSMSSIGSFSYSESFTGTGSALTFSLEYVPKSISSITIDGDTISEYSVESNVIRFITAPEDGVQIEVEYTADLYDSFTTFYPDLFLRVGGSIKFKCRYYAENGTTPLQCGVDEFGNPTYEVIVEEGGTAPDPTKRSYNESFDGDGTTTTFTLQNVPTFIESVYVSGSTMYEDVDYTLSGNEITFTEAPAQYAYILVSYSVGYIDVPTKPGDAQYTYTYVGWDNDGNSSLTNIHSNMAFVQTFEQTINRYTIYFVNDDGTPLYETTVDYGTEAVYAGSQNPPRKTNVDNPEEWTFTGWSKNVTFVTGTDTVYAVYASPIADNEIPDAWDQIMVNANNRYVETFTGNGTTTRFTLQFTPTELMYVKVGGVTVDGYTVSLNAIEFTSAPHQDAQIVIKYRTRTSYTVGNYKDLTLTNGTVLRMQIVGVNTDELADGSDTAQYSWISKNLYPTGHAFNDKYVEGIGKYNYNSETEIWSSDIAGKPFYNAVGDWDLTVTGTGTLTVRYMISSQTTHDYANIYVDEDLIANKISGETTWVDSEIPVENGQVVHVNATYHKDINQDGGLDTLFIRFVPSDGVTISTEFQGTNSIPRKGAIGGFDGMAIYPYLQEDFKALIPEAVRTSIKSVKKYTKSLLSDGTEITLDHNDLSTPEVWIPSLREVGFLTSTYETEGPTYNSVYFDASTRVKKVDGDTNNSYYWLRSQYTDESIACITSLGADGGLTADNATKFPIGIST